MHKHRPLIMILPTQHVMEAAMRDAENTYLNLDVMLLLTIKLHRDLMNQENVLSPLNIIDEYIDEIEALVMKFNRDRPFVDFLGSTNEHDVVLGYKQLHAICKKIYDKMVKAEYWLGPILGNTLPDSFYEYKCEPVMARLYAGDLVLKLVPIKSIGVQR